MDISLRSKPTQDAATARGRPTRGAAAARRRRSRVPKAVVLLGLTSLLTDISSEMVTAILPIFLTLQLGLSPAQFGVVDGLYRGISAVSRLLAGVVADLLRKPKLVATVGYAVSAATRPLLVIASSVTGVAALVSVDRLGKGIRTAPRDAMIAAASRPRSLAYNFGIHRAMDNVGALLGPLVAFGVLMLVPGRFDAVFVVSTMFALLGLAVIAILVPARPSPYRIPRGTPPRARGCGTSGAAATDEAQVPSSTQGAAAEPTHERAAAGEPETSSTEPPDRCAPRLGSALRCRNCGSSTPDSANSLTARRVTVRELVGLARSRGFATRVALAGAFTAFTVSDAFVFLTLLERNEDLASVFPLLAVGLGLAYAALAVPVGRVADRVGRMRTYLLGHVALLVVYVVVGGPLGMIPGTLLALLMLGLYYAATDGVLAASVSAVLPESGRTTGLALAQTVVAGAAMVSSVMFGLLFGTFGAGLAYLVMGVGLVLVLLVGRPFLTSQPGAREAA